MEATIQNILDDIKQAQTELREVNKDMKELSKQMKKTMIELAEMKEDLDNTKNIQNVMEHEIRVLQINMHKLQDKVDMLEK